MVSWGEEISMFVFVYMLEVFLPCSYLLLCDEKFYNFVSLLCCMLPKLK